MKISSIKSVLCILILTSCSEYRYVDKKLKYFENFRNDATGCFNLRVKYRQPDFKMFYGKDYSFLTYYLGGPNAYYSGDSLTYTLKNINSEYPGDSSRRGCAAYYLGGPYCEYISLKRTEPLTKYLLYEYTVAGYFFWFRNDTIHHIEFW